MSLDVIQKTISWINETFVPMGLNPIEDLPKACPGKASYCVIAEALKTNPKWKQVNVLGHIVNLNLGAAYIAKVGGYKHADANIVRQLNDASVIDIPQEVSNFITGFDKGEYAELIDVEQLELQWDSDDEYVDEMKGKIEELK